MHRRALLCIGACVVSPVAGAWPFSKSITEADVHAAQKAWGDGLIEVGACLTNGSDYVGCGKKYVEDVYGYKTGRTVLFKPTVAYQNSLTGKEERHQFRLTYEGAVSYMVGNNPKFPTDHGFALRPWVVARFLNADIIVQNDYALAMGDLYVTDPNGVQIRAEYSFGYFRDDKGEIKLMHHHSSLPFSPPKGSVEAHGPYALAGAVGMLSLVWLLSGKSVKAAKNDDTHIGG